MLIRTAPRRPGHFEHVGVINQQMWSAHARRRPEFAGAAGPRTCKQQQHKQQRQQEKKMTVTVQARTDQDNFGRTYEKGEDWFIDEVGRLFIRDATKKHIAAYSDGAWESVALSEPRLTQAAMEHEKTRRAEAEARRAEANPLAEIKRRVPVYRTPEA